MISPVSRIDYLEDCRSLVQIDLEMKIVADIPAGIVQIFRKTLHVRHFNCDCWQLFAGDGLGLAAAEHGITSRIRRFPVAELLPEGAALITCSDITTS